MNTPGVVRPPFPFRVFLKHTDDERLFVLHKLQVGLEHDLYLVGDPDIGSYEWVLHRGDELEYSDAGYGSPEVALRDALIAYLGAPDPATLPDTKKKLALKVCS